MKERKELSYEATYNMACALLDMGQLTAAQESLAQAEEKCLASLKKHQADEETTQDELAVLVVQMAYVLQLLRQPKEAKQMYLKALAQKPSDEAVVATANNNLITLRRQGEKVFDALKRSERTLKVPSNKLTTRQLRAFRLNHCLLLVYGKKGDEVQKQVQALQQEFKSSEMPTLVLAALYFRQKNYSQCMQTLQDAIAKNPEGALQTRLTLAHIALSRKEISGAIEALRNITQVAHRPAVVATLVALYLKADLPDKAIATLDDAVKHWASAMDVSDGEQGGSPSRERILLQTLLENAAAVCEEQKFYKQAAKYYQQLVNEFSHDPEEARRFVASLVLNLSRAAPEDQPPQQVEKFAKKLPSPEELGLLVSVARQLDPSVVVKVDKRKQADDEDAADDVDAKAGPIKRAHKRHKKKPKYPKNFDPANPGPKPDPERWLPKWERASFQKKNKRRARQDQKFKGFQGGVVNNALDASAPTFTAAVSSSSTTQATTVPINEGKAKAAAVVSAKAKGAAKKKKKGKKMF
eukprot:gb/GEZN01002848.1/.p1 GENE.gb/GEZN01002848.1/~~gb/GEZN01002848.1/.p1  ORF type:complete len:525 (+),score=118.27 gb/GEZN01002848.1/:646-2220(+)